MAQVTVEQLAKSVNASVERLLKQMKDAGLPHNGAEEVVSDEDKQTLLAFLKRNHGESSDAPRKITLKRKTISTLRTGSSQGKKTVNVEVRKKRTYIKRDAEAESVPEETSEQADAAASAEATAAGIDAPVAPVDTDAGAVTAETTAEPQAAAEPESPAPEPEPVFDAELEPEEDDE